MNLKNYTSGVPALTSISNIEAILIAADASAVAKEVKNKTVVAVMFQLHCGGRMQTIRIPANVDAVQDWLWKEHVTGATRNRRTRDAFREQAERTAWKIMLDWTQVQISLIKLNQADALQVFLAYIWDGNQTYYEYLKGNQFKALPSPAE